MATRATKKKHETALVPWEAELAAQAQAAAEKEKPAGDFRPIKIQGGVMTVDDAPVPGNALRCVILAALPENKYFATAYVSGESRSPDCYAFGDMDATDPEETMKPHEEASDPQADACASCPMNAWGSAETGRGKACKNTRRLAVITEDAIEDAESIEGAEVRTLSIPVTSVKNWKAYVRNKLPEVKRPCYGVVTEISVHPDPKSQFKVAFRFVRLIEFDGDTYAAMKAKVAAAQKDLATPYPRNEEAAPKRGRGGGKVRLPQAGKKAAPKAEAAPKRKGRF